MTNREDYLRIFLTIQNFGVFGVIHSKGYTVSEDRSGKWGPFRHFTKRSSFRETPKRTPWVPRGVKTKSLLSSEHTSPINLRTLFSPRLERVDSQVVIPVWKDTERAPAYPVTSPKV